MIAALILAAGQSRRMGRPKMSLPWGQSTVLGRVIQVVKAAGVADVLVVSGGGREAVEEIAVECQARTIFNPDYEREEMLSSLQLGLRGLPDETGAALVVLGDQPQIKEQTVRMILREYGETSAPLIVPSYQRRRGHPWLLGRGLWQLLLDLRAPESPRDFLRVHADDIHYVEVETDTIIQDLDTPEDYLKSPQ